MWLRFQGVNQVLEGVNAQSSDLLIRLRVSSLGLGLAWSKMDGGKTHAAGGKPSCSAYLHVCWRTIPVCARARALLSIFAFKLSSKCVWLVVWNIFYVPIYWE